MNKRIKKKRILLRYAREENYVRELMGTTEINYDLLGLVHIDEMFRKVNKKGVNIESPLIMNPIKDYFFKYYGEVPAEDEYDEVKFYRKWLSIDYDLIENYRNNLLTTEEDITAAKNELNALHDYYKSYAEFIKPLFE